MQAHSGETTMTLSCEVTINKPLQTVWDFVNEPDNLPLWIDDFVRYEHLTGDQNAPKVGDTANHVYSRNGKEFTMQETITDYNPPNHITLFLTSDWFDMNIGNSYEAVSEDQTKLVATAEFVRLGWVMKIMMFFGSKKKMQADHDKQIHKLKRIIEETA